MNGRIILAGLCLAVLSSSNVARAATLHFTTPKSISGDLEVSLTAVSSDGRSAPIERTIKLAAEEANRTELPDGVGWVVRLELPKGYWAQSNINAPSGATVDVSILETASITLPMTAPPKQVSARLEPRRPGGRTVTQDLFPCSATTDEKVVCVLPAGDWGYSVRQSGHVPEYFLGQAIEPGPRQESNTLIFRPGPSVAGWLAADGGDKPWDPSRARITVRPLPQRGPIGRFPFASIAPSGFFQLSGVAAGRYELVAYQEGFSREVRTLEIIAGMEALLVEPLRLGTAANLHVAISPPADPTGKPWNVEIRDAAGPEPDTVIGQGIARGGRLSWRELRAGHRYFLWISTSSGTRWRLDEEGFIARAPETELAISVDTEGVEGRVLRGKDAVPNARIVFGVNTNGPIAMDADQDGNFFGFLPRLGEWRVRVSAANISRTLSVVVARGPSGRAEAVLRLADRSIQGTLVNEKDDLYLEPAIVNIYDGKHREQLRISDGKFRVEGLSAGRYQISGDAAFSRSSAETVEVPEDESKEVDPIRLVMKLKQRLRIKVVDAGGSPLGRVPIAVLPTTEAGWANGVSFGYTDARGQWEYKRFESGQQYACLFVMGRAGGTSGYASRLERVALGPEEVVLPLEVAGGTIVTTDPSAGPNPAILKDGCPILRRTVASWGVSDFPLLAAGTYAVCPSAIWSPDDTCVTVSVQPFGSTKVSLPRTVDRAPK